MTYFEAMATSRERIQKELEDRRKTIKNLDLPDNFDTYPRPQQAAMLFDKGLGADEMCKFMGIGHATVRHHLRNAGKVEKQPDMRPRNREIFELRQSGATLREISDKYGVSSGRAGQIIAKVKRQLARHNNSDYEFSARAESALRNMGCSEFKPEEISKLTRRGLLCKPNVGPHTIKEIQDYLHRHGFDFSPDPAPEPKGLNAAHAERCVRYLEQFGYKVIPPKE